MAKPNIANITTAQTFQTWFDKTNEMVNLFKTDVITASSGGDTTTGNATLVGNFTASNLIASTQVTTNTIGAGSSAVINFSDPIQVTSGTSVAATFLYTGTGGQTRYTDGAISWDIGHDSDGGHTFIIDTGTGQKKFQLTAAGTLTVPNVIVTESLSANSLSLGAGGSGLNTDDITEGSTNLFYTDARARGAFTGGDGINVSASGVISFDGEGELNTYQGNEFITTGSVSGNEAALVTGSRLSGVPIGTLKSEWSGNNYNVLQWFPSGISVAGYGQFADDVQVTGGDVIVKTGSTTTARIYENGAAIFSGDVTTNGSFSDKRLKENIVPLQKGLEEVEQIKTYTFNYKDRPEDTLPGVIAQEIEKILPEVVYDIEMEDDTYKAVRYQQIVPVLIEAIKELSDKVNVLQNLLENKG
ncbi:MAG: tail fiber domain-containing protein [Alphaproteobacteria bacterium TMED194]|nr:MAG: tail fiber domain-containing protein [Alphaproteobacteria bacterium TMED194]